MEAVKHLRAVLDNLNKFEHWDAGLHQAVRAAEEFLAEESRDDLAAHRCRESDCAGLDP